MLALPILRAFNSGSNLIRTLACRGFSVMLSSPIKLPKILPAPSQSEVLLEPKLPLIAQYAGFKVKGSLRRRCKDCYFVMRQERLYVICKTHPRHKQMAMKQRDYKSWILTHATQSKIRPY